MLFSDVAAQFDLCLEAFESRSVATVKRFDKFVEFALKTRRRFCIRLSGVHGAFFGSDVWSWDGSRAVSSGRRLGVEEMSVGRSPGLTGGKWLVFEAPKIAKRVEDGSSFVTAAASRNGIVNDSSFLDPRGNQ